MKQSVSTIGYDHKPDRKSEYKTMLLRNVDVSLEELRNLIKSGHSFSGNYDIDYDFKTYSKTYSNFKSTNIVSVDVDDISLGWLEFSTIMRPTKPSIIYETFSNGIEGCGNRYRLLYCFSKPIISSEEYCALYYKIRKQVIDCAGGAFDITDDCGGSCVQLMNGTFPTSKDLLLPKNIDCYSVSEEEIETYRENNPHKAHKTSQKAKTTIDIDNIKPREVSSMLKDDAERLPYDEFKKEYQHKYPIIDRVEKDDWESIVLEDGQTIQYQEIEEDEYFKLWHVPQRIKDGSRRKRTLFLRAIERKIIKPSITPDETFYNLYMDLHHIIDNSADQITITDLVYIANQIERFDAEQLKTDYRDVIERLQEKNPKCGFILARQFNGNYSHNASLVNKHRVLSAYDPSLSILDNLHIMNDSGIKVSKATLMRYLNGNGSRKQKDNELLQLIDVSKSIRKNQQLLLSHGLHVSKDKITKLLKQMKNCP